MDETLIHYGILGMKWGVRRYQNEDGTLTEVGKKRYHRAINRLRRYDAKKQKVLESIPNKPYYNTLQVGIGTRLLHPDKRSDPKYLLAQDNARIIFNRIQKKFKNVKMKDISKEDFELIERYLKEDDFNPWPFLKDE